MVFERSIFFACRKLGLSDTAELPRTRIWTGIIK